MSPPGDDSDDAERDSEADDAPDTENVPTHAGQSETTDRHSDDRQSRDADISEFQNRCTPRESVSGHDTVPEKAANQETPSPDEWRSENENRPPQRQHDTDQKRSEAELFLYDMVSSILAVGLVGALLFAVSGVWPPLVAVESESMVPNMQVNDLVFVMDEHRFPGDDARPGTGVVTARAGSNHQQFGKSGDVIVFAKNGNRQTTPIIHRAMFWVDSGENWCRMGNADHLGGLDVTDDRCIADHGGFVTKGDNNPRYDQANGLSEPVKPEWVVGTAEFRIPGLGWVRLVTQ